MNFCIERITPQMAKQYLGKNINNRPLKHRLVDMYAREMACGNWRLTHQGIAFNGDGTLLDGQHRLAAIVQSGVTVESFVARNIDSRSQLVMDDHAKRTAGDALSLIRHATITQKEVAIIRAAVELQPGWSTKGHMTKQELDSVLDVFSPAIQFVHRYTDYFQRGITTAPVKASIVLAWFYVEDLHRLEEFCEILLGKSIPDGEGDRTALVFREWLLRTGMRHSVSRRDGFYKAQRAIFAFMQNRYIAKLYSPPVPYYPWPLVGNVRG